MTGECAACGKWDDLDRDHIKTRGSSGPDTEDNIWLICRACHILRHRHGLSWILEKYPHTKEMLESKGWEIIDSFGRKKLVRI